MQMLTAGIGRIVAAMQHQTVALAEHQQEQQLILTTQRVENCVLQQLLQQHDIVFTAQQERPLRQHRVAMEWT